MSDGSDKKRPEAPDSYEVGYGKPPSHSRFQKGRSGNPQGRPSRSKNMTTLLTKALDERVAVTENGRRRSITKREAIVTQLVNKSAAADLKAIGMLLSMIQQMDASAPATTLEPESFAEADERVLQILRERLEDQGKLK